VCAVDVGVGHDDHALVAQIIELELRAHLHAECEREIGQLLVAAHLLGAGAGDVQDFAAQRQDRLVSRERACLAEPPRGIAFDQEDFGVLLARARAIGELAGQAQLPRRRLAGDFLLLAPAHAVFRLPNAPIQQALRFLVCFQASDRTDRGRRSRRSSPLRSKPSGLWFGLRIAVRG
jgi:hypothetical protein